MIQVFCDVTPCLQLQDHAITCNFHPKQVSTTILLKLDIYFTVDTARHVRILETLSKPLWGSQNT